MTLRFLAGLALVLVPATASAMPVSDFLAKAEALRSKGAMALFSGDLKRLTKQIEADGAALRAENKNAEAAGRPKAYCSPAGGIRMGQKQVLEAMQEVAPAQRSKTDTKDAIRAYLARRHPCPA